VRNGEAMSTTDTTRVDMKRAAGVYRAMAAFDRSITFDPQLRELVKIRASILNGCAFCVAMHTKQAREEGESERRLYAVSVWHESPLFTERERAALALTDAVTDMAHGRGVPDEVYERAAEHFDEDELAQLIWAIAAINTWNRVAVTSHMVFPEED